MQQVEQVKQFVEGFMNQVLIPLAEGGMLNEELVYEAVSIYADELAEKEKPSSQCIITNEGLYSALHPHTICNFEYNGKAWASLEHYFQAAKFIGIDDTLAESIRQAVTVELAIRKAINATKVKPLVKPGWNDTKEKEFENATRAMLNAVSVAAELLNKTGTNPIIYQISASKEVGAEAITSSDEYFGQLQDGKGQNMYGTILMKIRSNQ